MAKLRLPREHTRRLSFLCAAFFLHIFAAQAVARAQSIASLQTTDTIIHFENTPNGPRLIDLITKDGQRWSNRATEAPLDSVELDGKRLAVRWKLNPVASSSDARKVAFVYESSAPKLRMTWE